MIVFSQVLALYKFLKSIPFVWKLLRNYAEIKRVLVDVYDVFESARKNGGIPTCDDTKKLLSACEIIFEKELIDLPDVDDAVVLEMFREINHNLVCTVKQERLKRGLNG